MDECCPGGRCDEAPPPDDPARCCAAFYEQDWVRVLLGDSFHPGGLDLTDRLLDDLALTPGMRVLDVACGIGTTAQRLRARFPEVAVVGFDVSAKNLERAAERLPPGPHVEWVGGDATKLSFDDDSFDAIVCECAVSTFADKVAVATGFARVLRPGGRLAMSDMAVYGELPADLHAFGAGWACVDDALPVAGYRELFEEAGLVADVDVDESDALRAMTLDLKKKLLLASLGPVAGRGDLLAELGHDLPTLKAMLDQARALVEEGRVRYCRLGFLAPA